MTTPERREKSRQSRVANRHFRALRARQTRSSPFSALLATGRTIPAGTLPRNAVQSIERLGIGELKWKFRISQITTHEPAGRMVDVVKSVSRANAPEAEMRCPDRPPALKWAGCQLMMESRRRGYRAQNT